jgi:hypothetical protein
VRRFLDSQARFVLSLHLHEGNDETAAFAYWRQATGLEDACFTKTFIKPSGTGHRKNHLPHGVCRVRVRRSSDHLESSHGLDRCGARASSKQRWYP